MRRREEERRNFPPANLPYNIQMRPDRTYVCSCVYVRIFLEQRSLNWSSFNNLFELYLPPYIAVVDSPLATARQFEQTQGQNSIELESLPRQRERVQSSLGQIGLAIASSLHPSKEWVCVRSKFKCLGATITFFCALPAI